MVKYWRIWKLFFKLDFLRDKQGIAYWWSCVWIVMEVAVLFTVYGLLNGTQNHSDARLLYSEGHLYPQYLLDITPFHLQRVKQFISCVGTTMVAVYRALWWSGMRFEFTKLVEFWNSVSVQSPVTGYKYVYKLKALPIIICNSIWNSLTVTKVPWHVIAACIVASTWCFMSILCMNSLYRSESTGNSNLCEQLVCREAWGNGTSGEVPLE